MAKNMARIEEYNSKGDICYLENICTIEDELNIEGSMEVSMF